MFRYRLPAKTLMIGLMAVLLLIPLNMIESKIRERQGLQQSVQQDIARSAAGPQTIDGPFLVIRYRLRMQRTTKDEDGNVKVITTESVAQEKVISPHSLKIDGNAGVETRNRGIYQARLFNLQSTIRGDFIVPADYGINKPPKDIIPEAAYFVVSVSDSRGIVNVPTVSLNGANLEFAPGSVGPIPGNGIHARMAPPEPGQAHTLQFEFPFNLQGMTTLAVTPAGDSTEMTLNSAWPHPSFGGAFLPRKREVSAKGFSAQWTVTNLARNTVTGDDTKNPGSPESFSVDFIDPINIYLMSERAVKYGIMFVVLIFTSFFVFEIMRGLRIHPMQYLLVGISMAMFFLLIISLSEHIPFLPAYLVSGAACVALIGFYLAGMLRNWRPALWFSGGIGLLYALLYGVLQSEDNALLMGTAIMFTALASVMMLTRHMDWYRLDDETAKAAG